MDFPRHKNDDESSLEEQRYDSSDISSPDITLIQYEPVQISPSSSHVGAEGFDWVLCYSDDIYRHWQRIEQRRMIVKEYSNMNFIRPSLIEILRDLQKKFGLAGTTLHLSAYILDNFLSRNSENIPLKFVVITSLLIAAKVEDVDVQMPRFADINQTMLNNTFSLIDYRNLEVKILICLNFRLTIPTIATFADFFSRISVVLDDFYTYQQIFEHNPQQFQTLSPVPDGVVIYSLFDRYDEMLAAINRLLYRLIDYTLDSVFLLNVVPSRKAAACIAAARQLFNVQPVWTPFLEMQSSYSEIEIRPVTDVIIWIYDMHHGSASSSSSSSRTNNSDNNAERIINNFPYGGINDICPNDYQDTDD